MQKKLKYMARNRPTRFLVVCSIPDCLITTRNCSYPFKVTVDELEKEVEISFDLLILNWYDRTFLNLFTFNAKCRGLVDCHRRSFVELIFVSRLDCVPPFSHGQQEENIYDFNFLFSRTFLIGLKCSSCSLSALHLNWKELKNENTKKKQSAIGHTITTVANFWLCFAVFRLRTRTSSFGSFCQIWYPRCKCKMRCNVNLHVIHPERFEMEQSKKTITRNSTDIWVLLGSRDVSLSSRSDTVHRRNHMEQFMQHCGKQQKLLWI